MPTSRVPPRCPRPSRIAPGLAKQWHFRTITDRRRRMVSRLRLPDCGQPFIREGMFVETDLPAGRGAPRKGIRRGLPLPTAIGGEQTQVSFLGIDPVRNMGVPPGFSMVFLTLNFEAVCPVKSQR
ncbi:hypothetical protein DQ04_07241020 [Trypanosoma grayi]|uniref:hypothetical protein n=1 Tax=Trypanosoma grayi TaxID=71804 RepID=UPI0004F44566|nr:hypothetical protein DQ04_07241020 [Trypanosoma grayi]KEG08414.1 hypothetical protein DQ04_07241020 [Trypanosoma grayi]